MQGNRKIIRGRENIEDIIQSQLRKEKESLRAEIKSWEGKFLFMILWVMNYTYGPASFKNVGDAYTRCNLSFYKVILCLKGIFDTVLEYKISKIRAPTDDEFEAIFKSFFEVSFKYFGLAPLYEKLETTQGENIGEIIIEDGEIKDIEDPMLYEVLGKWINISSSDPEWGQWYFTNNPEELQQAGKSLEKEFKDRYWLEFNDLKVIGEYFEQVSNRHLNDISTMIMPDGIFPFLYIERGILLKNLSMAVGKERAEKWIEVLEYKPFGDFRKCPLIPLKWNGKKIYALIYWIFTPSNAFFDAWTSPLMLGNTKTAGKMGQSYGDAFELYVDEKLRNANIKNLKNLGKRKIKSSNFPGIKPCLDRLPKQKEGFEVDRILIKEDLCFIISCKARDFAFQRKIRGRNFFFPLSEINRQISQNEMDLKEICIESECIAVNPKVRNGIGLKKQKYIVPVLLTSRVEPLGTKDVKEYFLKDEELKRIPVITVTELIKLLEEPSNDLLDRVKCFRTN